MEEGKLLYSPLLGFFTPDEFRDFFIEAQCETEKNRQGSDCKYTFVVDAGSEKQKENENRGALG